VDLTSLTQYGAAGVTVGIVLVGMRALWTLYLDTRKELRASASACAERETKLVERLQALEDNRHVDLVSVVNAAMESMRITAEALRQNSGAFRIMAEESGMHRSVARDPKDNA
jgi:hypothetical protein